MKAWTRESNSEKQRSEGCDKRWGDLPGRRGPWCCAQRLVAVYFAKCGQTTGGHIFKLEVEEEVFKLETVRFC
jgi:hypothetical protein